MKPLDSMHAVKISLSKEWPRNVTSYRHSASALSIGELALTHHAKIKHAMPSPSTPPMVFPTKRLSPVNTIVTVTLAREPASSPQCSPSTNGSTQATTGRWGKDCSIALHVKLHQIREFIVRVT
jgi:hypothetical protein